MQLTPECQADSFADFFSTALGEGLFAVSLEPGDFSPASVVFGAESFFAASLVRIAAVIGAVKYTRALENQTRARTQ